MKTTIGEPSVDWFVQKEYLNISASYKGAIA